MRQRAPGRPVRRGVRRPGTARPASSTGSCCQHAGEDRPSTCGGLLGLVRLYGRNEVLAAIRQALEYQTYDAAYVETLLLQERRRRELPSPTPLRPKRRELIDDIDLEEPDPARYDRLLRRLRRPQGTPTMTSPTPREAAARSGGAEAPDRIAEMYPEVLDEAARKRRSMLDVLATLIGDEVAARRQRALERRLRRGPPAQAKDAGRVRLQLPQTDPQAGHPAAVRLRLRGPARLRRLDRADRNGKVASADRAGLHRLRKGHLGSLHPRRGHDQHADHGPDQRHAGESAPALHHPVNFSSSMSWAICPSTNAVRTCCSRSSPPGMNPARSWSPRTEPSGTGARSSTWTTPWPPP